MFWYILELSVLLFLFLLLLCDIAVVLHDNDDDL